MLGYIMLKDRPEIIILDSLFSSGSIILSPHRKCQPCRNRILPPHRPHQASSLYFSCSGVRRGKSPKKR